MPDRVADRLLGHPPDQRDRRRRWTSATPLDRAPRSRSRPRRPGRSGPPGRRPGRRRAGRAGGSRPAATAGSAGPPRSEAAALSRRGPAARSGVSRVAGERGDGERGAGEVLDDAVVQVAGDPAALGGRGVDRRDAAAARGRGAAPVRRRVSTQIIGVASASSASSAPTVIRRNGKNTSLLALVDVGGRVVGLEEQRVALGRADLGVDLDQPARCRARSGSRASVRSETSASVPPSREDLALLLPERVAAADQLGRGRSRRSCRRRPRS